MAALRQDVANIDKALTYNHERIKFSFEACLDTPCTELYRCIGWYLSELPSSVEIIVRVNGLDLPNIKPLQDHP